MDQWPDRQEGCAMRTNRFTQGAIMAVLFLGVVVFGPVLASAGTQWNQQALLVLHIPVGGGQVFTTNFVFTATENATTVNVKCFNDIGSRVGPLAGVNIGFSRSNQVGQHTPTTLGLVSDALFTASGLGWCWASAPDPSVDFNVQATFGATSDLTPGGILSSPGATFIGHAPGSTETTAASGGVPFWTTAGGAQPFLVVLNPLKAASSVTIQLFDANGVLQGTGSLSRPLNPRSLVALVVPASFALTSPPTNGSIKIAASTGPFLGWYFQEYPNGRAVFAQVSLDADNTALLPIAEAP
jgi:hypothetical protein